SVLRRCASGALRARDSAAIATHARSGARFTTPSPDVTMTGGGGACCASAGVAVSRSAIANIFMASPSTIVRLKAEATGIELERTRHAEAYRVRIRVGRNLVAVAARQHAHVGDEPAAAAHDPQVPERRTRGIPRAGRRVIARVVPVVHPFPDVAGHVEQP